MAFVDTPRTEAGNATYLSNIHNINDLSVENSFLSPLKKPDDLLSQMRNNRGVSLRTPSVRPPFTDRRNIPALASQEFTPLLKSVTKQNTIRAGKENAVPNTPAFLKAGFQGKESPALQAPESSVLYGDETGSSVNGQDEGIPMAPMASSSAQSTPLAVLPKRNGDGVLVDQGNMMTLREQENIIDKIEKENFGLKLKIHYLEELLKKAGPELNQTALKENTTLKVDKVTMQKELSRTKKLMVQAERDLDIYRQRLQESQEDANRKQADVSLKQEIESLRQENRDKDTDLADLRRRLEDDETKANRVAELENRIEDLEADLREREQEIDERDEELEEKAAQASAKVAQLEEDLENAKEHIDELEDLRENIKDLQDEVERANMNAKEAKENVEEAQQAKRKAEDDLDELRDEMQNKSFSTKGLSRQLEEKANKLEDDLVDLREKHTDLEHRLIEKTKQNKRLEDTLRESTADSEVREQKLKDDIELLRHQHESAMRSREPSVDQTQNLIQEVQRKSEEKDLLQSRHDALTIESQSLQRDLSKAQGSIRELEQNLEEEKRHSMENDKALRIEAKEEMDRLNDEVDNFQRKLEDERSRSAADEEHWMDQIKGLQLQKEKAEQKANGLQRTIDRLQEVEGTLSNREMKIQEALESEKQRHQDEEALLQRQIKDLEADIDKKRNGLEDNRLEILRLKEELHVSRREQTASEEKIQALEDEIDVLQISLDEEADRARKDLAAAQQKVQELEKQIQTFQEDKQESYGTNDQNASKLRDVEGQLRSLRSENEGLQDQLAKTEIDLHSVRASAVSAEAGGHELSTIRHDLLISRKREAETLQRETTYKETIRGLKQEISNLERQLHDIEISKLNVDTPKSSANGSIRKNEIVEVRRQLAEAHQQMKDLRTKAKEAEKEHLRKIASAEKHALQQAEDFEQQHDDLEQQLASLRQTQESRESANNAADKTISRLRTRIQNLEHDLQTARNAQSDELTIAEERKDLHEMLKDAKLEAEDLQVQISERDTLIQAASSREKELRAQIQRVRDERSLQRQKATALTTELDNLQLRYEQKVDEVARQQQVWEEERRAIVSRVRFPNVSVSSLHGEQAAELKALETEVRESAKRHAGELKGLAKQIQWLRAKCKREQGFRAGLAFEKKFLLLKIEMFEACNTVDLHMLEEMGVTPDRKTREKKPTLKAVALMVVASVRMQRLRREWAMQRKLQAALVKKAEQVKRSSRKSGG